MKVRYTIALAFIAAGIVCAGCDKEIANKPQSSESQSPNNPLAEQLQAPVQPLELTTEEKQILSERPVVQKPKRRASNRNRVALSTEFAFEEPEQLKVAGKPIMVDSPGYACPTVADFDQDGKLDLVVGQFTGGKMRFFKNTSNHSDRLEFTSEDWIKTDGVVAEVPGVW